jgi:DNA mismatch endonuclease (patch repair protein)
MADVFTKEKRSEVMSKIKGADTKFEIQLRSYLHRHGFRFRKNDKKLPGKPDIVLPKYKTVIFIQGCFWHGHEGCKHFVIPKTRTGFWVDKINKNKANDLKNIGKLTTVGWSVIELWECELKKDFDGIAFELVCLLNRVSIPD